MLESRNIISLDVAVFYFQGLTARAADTENMALRAAFGQILRRCLFFNYQKILSDQKSIKNEGPISASILQRFFTKIYQPPKLEKHRVCIGIYCALQLSALLF